ncbi:MAG: histidine kinase dimerization/phospho-acceptor domain-containing protein [Halobacteria archaeon]|nr:histidine kinase dimerization/phospho-acceptor domain-containing protein [Halobacteria archaeon]
MNNSGTRATTDVSESFVHSGFDALPSQIAILDSVGDIVYTNRAWRDFGEDNDMQGSTDSLGVNYLEVCGQSEDESVTEAGRGILSVLNGDDDVFTFEYPCHSPDERRWFTMRAIRFEHADEDYVLVMHLDITERKLAELVVEEKNERLQTVASVLSHDLRNPLNVALGRMDMIAEKVYDAEGEEHVEAVSRSLERMKDIIEDALVLANRTKSTLRL